VSSDEHAFSLLELLVAVTLLLLLAGLSTPALAPLFAGNALKKACEELETALREAQLRGMALRRVETVLVQPDHFSFRRGELWQSKTIPRPAEVSVPGGDYPAAVRFYPSGAASPLTLRVRADGECRLTVSLRGRITNSCRKDAAPDVR
jgi:prepilin-type N-terminal cleavage/methylation domain-containing protein